MKDIEPTGQSNNSSDEIVTFIRKRYDEKNFEFEKRQVVREYLSKYIQGLLGSERGSSSGDGVSSRTEGFAPSTLFTSNLTLKGYEFATTAKLFPDQVDFSPTQPSPKKDQDTADNYSSLVRYTGVIGGYDKMVREAMPDMVFGECWITQEYQRRGDTIVKPQYKSIPWEQVRGFYGETDLITIENLTVGQFVKIYGKDMLKNVQFGFPFSVNDEYEKTTVDFEDKLDKAQKIGIVKYYDHALKRYHVLMGGGAYMPKEMQMDGDDYFWVDDDGDGYCPVKSRVYKRPVRGYHGYGILDTLWVLAYLETVIVNSSSHAAVLASDPLLLFYADDISEMENKWNQYLSTKVIGNQSPFFLKTSKTNPIKADQLAFDPNINIFKEWRNFVIEEATMRSGFDYKILIEYAPTDGQQKSRKFETDKTNRTVLSVNAVSDKEFAMETIYMLKNGDSEFHDRILYTKVGDYFYENMDEEERQQMKGKDGMYERVPVKIRDFLDENKETEFALTTRLDGVLDDQDFFEMQDARNDLALLMPGTESHIKLSQHYFKKKYGAVQFNREDFAPPAPELPPEQPVQ